MCRYCGLALVSRIQVKSKLSETEGIPVNFKCPNWHDVDDDVCQANSEILCMGLVEWVGWEATSRGRNIFLQFASIIDH